MKRIFFSAALIAFMFSVVACNDCKTCTLEVESFVDGVKQGDTQVTEGQEFCGIGLELIENQNFEESIIDSTAGVVTETRTTYSCN